MPSDVRNLDVSVDLFIGLAVALLLSSFHPSHAQTLTGEIDIIVVDQTGAVIPGAKVTIQRAGTSNVVRTLATNAEGVARVSLLLPGTYDIHAESKGFKTVVRNGIPVDVAQVVSLRLKMEPGAVTQSVTVVGNPPQLEEKSAHLAQGFNEQTITNLPLNGRNYLDLGRLAAGAVPSVGSRDQTFSVYGNNGIQNAFVLDGERNQNFLRGLDNRARDALRPPLDALQEFSVQTTNFSAEYGASAGAVVLAVTRSGTNDLHGSAYEFLRNNKLDARDFFNRVGRKPRLIRNQYGGSIGGPIRKNRAWLFGAYERTSNISEETVLATVPTATERQGVFSVPIFDPSTTRPNPKGSGFIRDEFPNGSIPSSMFDPVGKALLDRYPLPNLPGTRNNFGRSRPVSDNEYNLAVRGDVNFSSRDTFFARYSFLRQNSSAQAALPPPAQAPVARITQTNGLGFGYTRTVGSSMVNELRFGWTRLTLSQDEALPFEEIVRGSIDPQIKSGIPSFAVSGFPTIGAQPPGLGNNPLTKRSVVYDISDNFSWSRGKHLLKFGFDQQLIHPTTFAALSGRGSFGFTGVFTQNPQRRAGSGSSVADLLLGIANSSTTGTPNDSIEREKNFGVYGEDRWSVTRNLTVNLGLRYELFYSPFETRNRESNLILDGGDPLFGQFILAGDPRKDRSLLRLSRNNLAPRVGLAYRVPGVSGLVVRAAYGIFYGQDAAFGVSQRLTANPPFFGFGGQSTVSDQLFPSSGIVLGTASLPRPAPIDPRSFVLDPNSTFTLRSWVQLDKPPLIQEWNVSVQKQLPWNVVWEANYVGNIGIHLPLQFNINQPLVPGPGSPNNRRPLANITRAQVIRHGPFGKSTYEGLSTRLQKQFSNGLSFLSTLTYGHAFDFQNQSLDVCDGCNEAFSNNFDVQANHAPSDNNIGLRYVFAGIWSLPFGLGRPYVVSGTAAQIVGGWNVSGIFTAQDGRPFGITLPFDNTNVGAQSRPNRLCNGQLGDITPERAFDTSCFVVPTQFTFGNSGRNILTGPGRANVDFRVARDFHVGIPTEAAHLRFQAEFFNFFNHPHLGTPGTSVGTPTFGVISGTSSNNREIQFALRWLF